MKDKKTTYLLIKASVFSCRLKCNPPPNKAHSIVPQESVATHVGALGGARDSRSTLECFFLTHDVRARHFVGSVEVRCVQSGSCNGHCDVQSRHTDANCLHLFCPLLQTAPTISCRLSPFPNLCNFGEVGRRKLDGAECTQHSTELK